MVGGAKAFRAVSLSLKSAAAKYFRRIPLPLAEVLPHLTLPLSFFILWLLDGSWVGWCCLILGVVLRFGLRSQGVVDTAALLTQSGLVLLPEDDNKVVEDFLRKASVSDIVAMQQGLLEGAEVSVYNLKTSTELNGEKGKVVRWQDSHRVVVRLEGREEEKAFKVQNLTQTIEVWGQLFTYTRR
eukprot:Sspe_Gene.80362::Locus_50713_Transcript_1_1_Confidence_1.000_Length_768::g.80362::m.80362